MCPRLMSDHGDLKQGDHYIVPGMSDHGDLKQCDHYIVPD